MKWECFFLMLFCIASCRNDSTMIPKTILDNKQGPSIIEGPSIKFIGIDEARSINKQLISILGKDIFNAEVGDVGAKPIFDEEVIKGMDAFGNPYYTFRYRLANGPFNEFFNLILAQDVNGKVDKAIVIHYMCDPIHYKAFEENGFNPIYFQGSINVLHYDLHSRDHISLLRDGLGKAKCNETRLFCIEANIENSTREKGTCVALDNGRVSMGNPTFRARSGSLSMNKYFLLISSGKLFMWEDMEEYRCESECKVLYEIGFLIDIQERNRGIGNRIAYNRFIVNMGSKPKYLVHLLKTRLLLSHSETIFLENSPEFVAKIFSLFDRDNWTPRDKKNIKEVIRDVFNAPHYEQQTLMNAFYIVVEADKLGLNYIEMDSGFTHIINHYTAYDIDSSNSSLVHVWFVMQNAMLRANHPDWEEWKILWKASRIFLGMSLESIETIPGIGRLESLSGDSMYYARRDDIGDDLYYYGPGPFIGQPNTIAPKCSIKIIALPNGSKAALEIVENDCGLLDFGLKSSKLFRKQLRLQINNGVLAHHVIPWELNGEKLVQVAARWKWHPMDASINGKVIELRRYPKDSQVYIDYVKMRMDGIIKDFPEVLENPQKAYVHLNKLSKEIQWKIDQHPNKRIDELFE